MSTPYPGDNSNNSAGEPLRNSPQPYGQTYGQEPYGQQPYGQQTPDGNYMSAPAGPTTNGMAVAALIFAILGILGALLLVVGLPFALIGLILSILALMRAKKVVGDNKRKGMSITALILSILGLVAPIVIIAGLFMSLPDGFLDDLQKCNESGTQSEQQECFSKTIEFYYGN